VDDVRVEVLAPELREPPADDGLVLLDRHESFPFLAVSVSCALPAGAPGRRAPGPPREMASRNGPHVRSVPGVCCLRYLTREEVMPAVSYYLGRPAHVLMAAMSPRNSTRRTPPGLAGSASCEASVDPGQDVRQDVVRADVDGPFGILRRLEDRDVGP